MDRRAQGWTIYGVQKSKKMKLGSNATPLKKHHNTGGRKQVKLKKKKKEKSNASFFLPSLYPFLHVDPEVDSPRIKDFSLL